jgi:uncharacterized protein (TIGR00251 family)
MTSELKVSQRGATVQFEVHVVPRASKSAVVGVHDGRLKVTLAAPPVDGEANAALIALLAKLLKRAKREVELVRGESSRHKTVSVAGVTAAEVRALLLSP